jgi:hypothetical protein
MLNPTDFIKYIKSFGFPFKNYNAIKDYPNTLSINNKKTINKFTEKYNIKFILNYKDENILLNTNNDNLFLKSLNYISNIQKILLKNNIKTYIAGGSAIKLYSLINKNILKNYNINKNILKTSDFDIRLFNDNNKLSNKTILNNLEKIIDLININIENQIKNKIVLKFFCSMNLYSKKDLINTLEIFLNLNYDLYKYKILIKNDDCTYYFDFIKKNSNTSYIILNLKLKKYSLNILKKCDAYSFIKINICNTNNNKLYYIYNSIDIVLHNKNDLNINLKTKIKYNNNIFYILNEKSILYNLINLYYDYKNLLNIMEEKIKEGKNIRDEKRLDYVFKLYCKLFYKNMNNNSINKTLDLIKLKNKKFSKCIFLLKDLSILDNFFMKYNVLQ